MSDRLNRFWLLIKRSPTASTICALTVFCIGWVFWPTLTALFERWTKDAEYSHGYLVPMFALVLLIIRSNELQFDECRASWAGLLILSVGLALRGFGSYIFFDWLAAAALIPCLAGIVVLALGWRGLRWAWIPIAYLAFMIPLPYRVEVALAQPLQRVATATSTYAIQTLGFSAYAEGNVICLGTQRIGIVEACSGLSMLLVFFALSTAVVLTVRMKWPEKVIIVFSAFPIAVIANVIRITVTAILYKTAGARIAELVFHDLAGWLMMPLALIMLWGELKILAWVAPPGSRRRRTYSGSATGTGQSPQPTRQTSRRSKRKTRSRAEAIVSYQRKER